MNSDDWCTPKWLADFLGPWGIDPCSNSGSHVKAFASCCLDGKYPPQSEGHGRDGLQLDWSIGYGSVFCNPPYSNVLPWALRLASHDGPWCALVKLDPTTKWWATLMTANPTVAPFRKRIKFEGDKNMTANFPSVLVYSAWRPSAELRKHLWVTCFDNEASKSVAVNGTARADARSGGGSES